jgi:hypothetical protein
MKKATVTLILVLIILSSGAVYRAYSLAEQLKEKDRVIQIFEYYYLNALAALNECETGKKGL